MKWNFRWILQELATNQSALIASLNLLIIRWSWVKIGHRNKNTCSESILVQSSRSKSRTCPRKSWKVCLLRFQANSTATSDGDLQNWIDCNQSLQPNLSQMRCDVLKPFRGTHWLDKLRFSIWSFFEQFSTQNNHLLSYWATIYDPIWKICPKFQVLNSHILEVNEHLCPMRQEAIWNYILMVKASRSE